ncbi:ABC transporter permease subunit, partial [Xylella fastidiosa subsp. multiplex]|nr:ABC transporter permease subunit [Xylella fastidiosa subsp. multiplex]
IPAGQAEASRALGLSWWQMTRLVVLPQALHIGVAPTVGFAVQIVKSTALTSIIAITICDDNAGQMRASAGFSTMCRNTCPR